MAHHHGKTPYKTLALAIVLVVCFAAIEGLVGWWANSLALLGDAGHMITDGFALGIAAFAAYLATRPPSKSHSYGLGRAEVIAAAFNSFLMLIIALVIILEAVKRFHHPPQVHGVPVMVVAAMGLLLNLTIAWLLGRSEHTLNIRAALLHVLGDALGSLAALASGIVIYFSHWLLIDPILSIFISLLIIFSSIYLLRETIGILMEGVPSHIELQEVATALKEITAVEAIHDLHIWTLTSGRVALSTHLHLNDMSQWDSVLQQTQAMLEKKFHINHVTIQPETQAKILKYCPNPKNNKNKNL